MERLRRTKQQIALETVLASAERPLTAGEIQVRAGCLHPGLGSATVYRELARLCAGHRVRTVRLNDDPPRYELRTDHHHHFRCRCGTQVYDLDGCLPGMDRLLPKGFHHEGHDIVLHGVCAVCTDRKPEPALPPAS